MTTAKWKTKNEIVQHMHGEYGKQKCRESVDTETIRMDSQSSETTSMKKKMDEIPKQKMKREKLLANGVE